MNKLYRIKDTIRKITKIYKLGSNRSESSLPDLPKVPTCQSSLGLAFVQFLVEKLLSPLILQPNKSAYIHLRLWVIPDSL